MRLLALSLTISVLSIIVCRPGLAQSIYDTSTTLHQTVVLDGVSADVSVFRAAQTGAHIVRIGFFSSSPSAHPQCLSAYRDFTYVLRDSGGHIVPVDKGVLAHPPFESPMMSAIKGPTREVPCERRSDSGALREAELRYLYPRLPNGSYTLQMFFWPRGGSQKAALKPISFIVGDKDPL